MKIKVHEQARNVDKIKSCVCFEHNFINLQKSFSAIN